MKNTLRSRIALQLVAQMIVVVLIISLGFYFVVHTQTKQMRQRVLDKAGLFSSILGTHLDKIVGDNLSAYQSLQEATVAIVAAEPSVEELRIIAPEYIILTASSGRKVWEALEEQYLAMAKEAIKTGRARSIVKTAMGKEMVVHFMPLFESGTGQRRLIGVMQIIVRFPSQQGRVMSSLRVHKSAYFKKEAALFAAKLAERLEDVLRQAQGNFEYLEGVIEKIRSDEEIEDIKLFSKDFRMLISASQGRQAAFMARDKTSLYTQALQQEKIVTVAVEGSEHLIEVASPLYLGQGSQRQVAGAVGILLSLEKTQGLIAEQRRNIFVLSLIIAGAFCLLIGLFFKRKVLTPVNELIVLAEHLAKGDFSQRADIRSLDEIGKLSGAFNRMADELEKSKRQIEAWNVGLQEKVDAVTIELKQKQAQLLESEKLASLGVLSSGIAHEINNPLGIILGHTQMLLKEFRDKGRLENSRQAQELLEMIEEYTNRCSHIVKSLLQFARSRELVLQETSLEAALENALAFTDSRLSGKGIEVSRKLEASLPRVHADPIQLEQVFANIILNAEQSMPEGGKIEITAASQSRKASGAFVTIAFQDTGKGIVRDDLRRIFDPFFSTKEPGEGVGLGLSVSYGIIKAHGGDIEVKSQVNRGTKVVVKLPLRRNSDGK